MPIDRRRFLATAAGVSLGLADLSGWGLPPRRAWATERTDGREDAPPATGRMIRVAAIALATVDGMFENNYARALRLAEISLRHKPDLVLLPEAFAAGYCGKPLANYAEHPATSRHLAGFRRLSARAGAMMVLGYLEKIDGDRRVHNAVTIYDRGESVGTHYKHNLWSDAQRSYRDEVSLMIPGRQVEVFATRLGRFAVLTCYENYFSANWDALAGKVDFVLSPYNCEHDPADNNVAQSKRLGIPSAWADRTGTVFCGDGYTANKGSAGMVDAAGTVLAHSAPGVEVVTVGNLILPETSRDTHRVTGQEVLWQCGVE